MGRKPKANPLSCQICQRVDGELATQLIAVSESVGVKQSVVVRDALRFYLESLKVKTPVA